MMADYPAKMLWWNQRTGDNLLEPLFISNPGSVHKPSTGNNNYFLEIMWKQSWWLLQLSEKDVFISSFCIIFQGFLVTFRNCPRTCSYRINLREHVAVLLLHCLSVSHPPCVQDVEFSLSLKTIQFFILVCYFIFSCLK